MRAFGREARGRREGLQLLLSITDRNAVGGLKEKYVLCCLIDLFFGPPLVLAIGNELDSGMPVLRGNACRKVSNVRGVTLSHYWYHSATARSTKRAVSRLFSSIWVNAILYSSYDSDKMLVPCLW